MTEYITYEEAEKIAHSFIYDFHLHGSSVNIESVYSAINLALAQKFVVVGSVRRIGKYRLVDTDLNKLNLISDMGFPLYALKGDSK
jgi:hypothetical protein